MLALAYFEPYLGAEKYTGEEQGEKTGCDCQQGRFLLELSHSLVTLGGKISQGKTDSERCSFARNAARMTSREVVDCEPQVPSKFKFRTQANVLCKMFFIISNLPRNSKKKKKYCNVIQGFCEAFKNL